MDPVKLHLRLAVVGPVDLASALLDDVGRLGLRTERRLRWSSTDDGGERAVLPIGEVQGRSVVCEWDARRTACDDADAIIDLHVRDDGTPVATCRGDERAFELSDHRQAFRCVQQGLRAAVVGLRARSLSGGLRVPTA